MKKVIEEKKGFVLVITIIGLAAMSVFGMAILGITMSNLKATMVDGKTQGAYYIAEAGINCMIDRIDEEVENTKDSYESAQEFFQNIEDEFLNKEYILNNFEENNKEQSTALVTINRVGTVENPRDYRVESVGHIGNRGRTVSSLISISWISKKDGFLIKDVFIYSSKFTFTGSSINGEGGTIISGGLLTHDLNGGTSVNVTNLYFGGPVTMDGGSASLGSELEPGNIFINGGLDLWNGSRDVYGDIIVNGDFKLKDAKMYGDVYVDGNLELGWTPEIHKNIYYTGTLSTPNNYYSSITDKCIKVDIGDIPTFSIPRYDLRLKDDVWYIQNGYSIRGNVNEKTIPNNARMVVDSYYSDSSQSPEGFTIIISRGDIEITGWRNLTGVLLAPNGKVKLNIGSFTGVIMSKEELTATGGGWEINALNLSDFFPKPDDMPIDIFGEGTEDEGEAGEEGTEGDEGGDGELDPNIIIRKTGLLIKEQVREK